jgi:hypothetical protein
MDEDPILDEPLVDAPYMITYNSCWSTQRGWNYHNLS